MNPVGTVVVAVWAMLPAYLPNNVAVLAGGGPPIDGGRTWGDERLLGDGKTWRGTGVGVVAGIALAFLLNQVQWWVGQFVDAGLPGFPAKVAAALALGAMLGDVGASFLKRRTGRERGAPFPVVDQLDFAVGALVLSGLAAPEWFIEWFLSPPTVLVVVLVATPLLHVGTNAAGYLLGITDEPW